MPYSNTHVFWVATSIVYLLVLTAVAAYALFLIGNHYLPIPMSLGVLVLVFPCAAGIAVQVSTGSAWLKTPQDRPNFNPRLWIVFLLAVFNTVLATLSITYATSPTTISYGLNEKWQVLFHDKNAEAIRTIQDSFNCCGLHSLSDRAFPFPDREHDAKSCLTSYRREHACFEPWWNDEQLAGGLLFLVAALTFTWEVVIALLISLRRCPWINTLPRQNNEDGYERCGGPGNELSPPNSPVLISPSVFSNEEEDEDDDDEDEQEGGEQIRPSD